MSDSTSSGPGVVVLAAYRPNPELFAVQLRSIRDQTRRDFRCLVGLDGYLDLVSEHAEAGDAVAATEVVFATRRDVGLTGGVHDDFFLGYGATALSVRSWIAGLRVRRVTGAR